MRKAQIQQRMACSVPDFRGWECVVLIRIHNVLTEMEVFCHEILPISVNNVTNARLGGYKLKRKTVCNSFNGCSG